MRSPSCAGRAAPRSATASVDRLAVAAGEAHRFAGVPGPPDAPGFARLRWARRPSPRPAPVRFSPELALKAPAKTAAQTLEAFGPGLDQGTGGIDAGNVNDHRIVAGAGLGGEDFLDCRGVQGVGARPYTVSVGKATNPPDRSPPPSKARGRDGNHRYG